MVKAVAMSLASLMKLRHKIIVILLDAFALLLLVIRSCFFSDVYVCCSVSMVLRFLARSCALLVLLANGATCFPSYSKGIILMSYIIGLNRLLFCSGLQAISSNV